jgi:hypothetical protein
MTVNEPEMENDAAERRGSGKHSFPRFWRGSKKPPHYERELFGIALLVFGATFSNIISQQDAVHFALTSSLVNSHTIFLNSTLYSGEPYVKQVGSHSVSALPPGLAFFGSPVIAPSGIILPLQPSVVAAYLATYFSCVIGALALVFFYRMARMFGSARSSLIAAVVFAFGTSMWSYSRMYLPEGLATLFGIGSVYCVLWARRRQKERNALGAREDARSLMREILPVVLGGFLLGLAAFVDNMAVYFAVPLFLFLLLRPNVDGIVNRLSGLLAFSLGLLAGALPIAYYDYLTTGSPLTAPYGIPLFGGVPLAAYNENFFRGLYLLILSPASGVLFFTPFLVISIIGVFQFNRKSGRSWQTFPSGAPASASRFEEYLVLAGLFLSILIPFSLQNPLTYAHNTIGPSEMVLAMPFAIVPSVIALDRFRKFNPVSIVAYILAALSIVINGIVALTDPVNLGLNIANYYGGSFAPFFSTNIPLFVGQSYLTWWSFFRDPIYYASAVLAFPIAILLIYSLTEVRSSFANQTEEKSSPPLLLTLEQGANSSRRSRFYWKIKRALSDRSRN